MIVLMTRCLWRSRLPAGGPASMIIRVSQFTDKPRGSEPRFRACSLPPPLPLLSLRLSLSPFPPSLPSSLPSSPPSLSIFLPPPHSLALLSLSLERQSCSLRTIRLRHPSPSSPGVGGDDSQRARRRLARTPARMLACGGYDSASLPLSMTLPLCLCPSLPVPPPRIPADQPHACVHTRMPVRLVCFERACVPVPVCPSGRDLAGGAAPSLLSHPTGRGSLIEPEPTVLATVFPPLPSHPRWSAQRAAVAPAAPGAARGPGSAPVPAAGTRPTACRSLRTLPVNRIPLDPFPRASLPRTLTVTPGCPTAAVSLRASGSASGTDPGFEGRSAARPPDPPAPRPASPSA